ncbi:MAG: MFS transporter [Alphaproteobacteria bacterium]|nr:MFS transporter [Alphaproteobacteria bacterium]
MVLSANTELSARLSLGFSCIGHSYSHLFAPIFFIAVLALEKDLGLTHGEAVSLILIGNALFGFAAPVAGWLGDRWKATAMMSVFFIGTGAGLIATGLARTPFEIMLGLAATGLFASIYHPVGLAWLIRNAVNRGTALGVNNMFGGFGPAAAALMTGVLIDWAGWRAAFLAPGAMVIVTGAVFAALVARGAILDSAIDRKPEIPIPRGDATRALGILFVTILCTSLIYQATQPAIPKLFSERVIGTEAGLIGISSLVAAVYALSGILQVVYGRFSDIFSPRRIYAIGFVIQAPVLFLAGLIDGMALVAVVFLMIFVNAGSTTAENVLFTRYTPSRWRSLAFGLKFIVALGIATIGVRIEGWLYDWTGGFQVLFVFLASLALIGAAVALLVPAADELPRPIAQPAE